MRRIDRWMAITGDTGIPVRVRALYHTRLAVEVLFIESRTDAR